MDDSISRQAAIKIIKNYCENGCDIAEDNWCPSCQREQFIKLLEQLPSAPERKTGKWVWSDEDASWKCGSCDCVFEEFDWKPEYNYCPNCGAYIMEDEDERNNEN